MKGYERRGTDLSDRVLTEGQPLRRICIHKHYNDTVKDLECLELLDKVVCKRLSL
jgi:hypothetical protein